MRRKFLSIARLELITGLSRRALVIIGLPVIALIVASFWLAAQFLHPIPPRKVVLATGPEHGMLHSAGMRYREILARNGVALELRTTAGAGENLELLRRANADVDVAFLIGGITGRDEASGLVNIANVAPAPLWILYSGDTDLSELDMLVGRRVAVGPRGSAIDVAVMPLLAANGITASNTSIVPLPFADVLRALRDNEVDVVFYADSPFLPAFLDMLATPGIRLMNMARADAYTRRYPHLHRMDLPAGTFDFARRLPQRDLRLIGTVVMVVARDSVHPTIVDLLLDAAQEVHGGEGSIERRGSFPHAQRIDEIAVSEESIRYLRSGPSFLRRYLPLWLADFLQRTFTLALPIVLVVLPLLSWIPKGLSAFMQNRIDDVYEDLRTIELQIIEGRAYLDSRALWAEMQRIETEVARLRVPLTYSRELYVLRSHVQMVREELPGPPPAS